MTDKPNLRVVKAMDDRIVYLPLHRQAGAPVRYIEPSEIARVMRDDLAMAALCDERPNLFPSSHGRRRPSTSTRLPDTGARKSGTFISILFATAAIYVLLVGAMVLA